MNRVEFDEKGLMKQSFKKLTDATYELLESFVDEGEIEFGTNPLICLVAAAGAIAEMVNTRGDTTSPEYEKAKMEILDKFTKLK